MLEFPPKSDVYTSCLIIADILKCLISPLVYISYILKGTKYTQMERKLQISIRHQPNLCDTDPKVGTLFKWQFGDIFGVLSFVLIV